MAQYNCASCNKVADAPDDCERTVIACIQCGRCLQAPPLGSNHPRALRDQAADAGALTETEADTRKRRRFTVQMILGSLLLGLLGGAVMANGLDFHTRMLGVLGGVLFFLTAGTLFVGIMQRNRAVRQALLVPLPDVLPPEAGRLGAPRAVFHTVGPTSALVFIALGLVFCAAGAVGISALVQGKAHGRMLEIAVVGTFAGVLAICHGLRCLWSRYYLLVCPEGFVRLCSDRADVCRWDEIEAFEEEVDESRKDQLGTSYRLRRTDGERFVFKGNHLESIHKLGAAIRQEMSRWQLPDLVRKLRGGGTIEFGKLHVSPEGIGNGTRTLPWEEVAGLQVNGQQLAILCKGTLRSWCKVKTTAIPNAFLFQALIQESNVPVGEFHGLR